MKNNYIIFTTTILAFFFSCNQENKNLERALSYAEENRKTLESVLEFYKNDSLKYKAACFLIENMYGHFSFSSNAINEYYNTIDSINECNVNSTISTLIAAYQKTTDRQDKNIYKPISDIKQISAKYLIDNIEHSFDAWEKGEWATHITFDQFCEYILPYKCNEFQILDNWKDYAKDFCRASIDSLRYCSLYKNLAFAACDEVNMELSKKVKMQIVFDNSYIPIKRLSSVIKMPIGTCDDQTFIAACVMRAKGIPVAIDYVPQWPFRNMGHSWNVLLDNNGKNQIFTGCESRIGIPHNEDHKKAKVFRKTYAINRELEELLDTEGYIPKNIESICIKDVTDEYAKTFNIDITIDQEIKSKYIYLAIFDNKEWSPIHWGKLLGKKARFFKMGSNIVYLPVSYDENGIKHLSAPFLLTPHGEINKITPNMKNKQDLIIYRKYYVAPNVFYFYKRLNGATIQASNFADFRDHNIIHTIRVPNTQHGEIMIDDTIKKYRYWRLVSGEGSHCSIAELYFFKKGETKPSYGNIIGSDGSYNNNGNTKEFVFDENHLSFFDAPTPSRGWVGMDFVKPVNIDRICYIPRGDGNYISIGDEYELLYWNDSKWNSLGRKIADDIKLRYKDCPTEALFLLKNHSEGIEERIFTYENGEQVWW